MKRLHVIGGKNHGKTTLIVELVRELARHGVPVGTIKHTHHQHELDVPGKDSYQHRMAGATIVGILSPSMHALFLPVESNDLAESDRYSALAPMFAGCQLVLVEGDSQTTAPKIEVWRSELGRPPLAASDQSILVVVTDDIVPVATARLPRSDVASLSKWILNKMCDQPLHR